MRRAGSASDTAEKSRSAVEGNSRASHQLFAYNDVLLYSFMNTSLKKMRNFA